jgi:glycosyltransferase involved in cell wall biosynthesis
LTGSSLCEIHIFGAARTPWHEAYKKKTLSKYRGEAEIIDHGLMPHDRLKEVYAQIDVLIVPSLLPEAFGLVVAESFSAGNPAIVFNSGALPELVSHGKDGFIVQENDAKSLALAMQKFIDDPELTLSMATQIPHVRTIQEHVNDMEKIYLLLVKDKVYVC